MVRVKLKKPDTNQYISYVFIIKNGNIKNGNIQYENLFRQLLL